MKEYIRFDWAMKRLLRDKANHEIIEGLLESLLGKKYFIEEILEPKGTQEWELDKYNRMDILAKDGEGALYIFEIQNNYETYYFHRMLYGVSKVVSEYIRQGGPYSEVKKVYSINIVYFNLGQGEDYVYHGHTDFYGVHKNDRLTLSDRQRGSMFGAAGVSNEVSQIFPEYYILNVNDFDGVAKTPLDEWLIYLRHTRIAEQTAAPGLQAVREKLACDEMPKEERQRYAASLKSLNHSNSVLSSQFYLGKYEGRREGRKEGRKEGKQEGKLEIAANMRAMGVGIATIAKYSGFTEEEIKKL